MNLALLTDGLRAEREQGITIDVAYRYFQTAKRKFIIADTPGHEQYTRNMVTGASTADLVADAHRRAGRRGRADARATPTSRSLLRIPHLVVCVNKMDLVDWDEEVFDRIVADFTAFAAPLELEEVTFIPISALPATTSSSARRTCPGTTGPRCWTTWSRSTWAAIATRSTPASRCSGSSARMPARHPDYRGYAGRMAGGVLRPGRRGGGAALGRRAPASPPSTAQERRSSARSPALVHPPPGRRRGRVARRHDLPGARGGRGRRAS